MLIPHSYIYLSQNVSAYVLSDIVQVQPTVPVLLTPTTTTPIVPFYSQFKDITLSSWKKVGCGIASIAMIIDYYRPEAVSVDTLLGEALALRAYDKNAGWIHKGLIHTAKAYGLSGKSYDVTGIKKTNAFQSLTTALKEGPVIVSIHYRFDPANPIPHLVVIEGITDGVLTYNDPAAPKGHGQISTAKFLKAWKQKFIVLRPVETAAHTA